MTQRQKGICMKRQRKKTNMDWNDQKARFNWEIYCDKLYGHSAFIDIEYLFIGQVKLIGDRLTVDGTT
jgi:hypothetical protein